MSLFGDIAGAVFGNNAQSDAENKARAEYKKGRNASLKDQQATYDAYAGRLDPWYQVGRNALADLGTFQADPQAWLERMPGYQFRLQQGLDGVNSQAATRGMLGSGKTLKALTQYGQNYASNAFGDEWNRLMGLSGMGYNAGTNIGGADQHRADAAQAARLGAANALGSSYIRQGDNTAGMWGGISGSIGNAENTILRFMGG
jgi:hypothetical protein